MWFSQINVVHTSFLTSLGLKNSSIIYSALDSYIIAFILNLVARICYSCLLPLLSINFKVFNRTGFSPIQSKMVSDELITIFEFSTNYNSKWFMCYLAIISTSELLSVIPSSVHSFQPQRGQHFVTTQGSTLPFYGLILFLFTGIQKKYRN